jgi:integrase
VLGLPGLRFHDLRHTAASLFAGSGMPLARVARLLGHAETATTYRLYLHFFRDDYAADMDRLDSYLAPRAAAPPLAELPPRVRRA